MLHHIFVSIFVTLSAKLCLDVMAIDLEVGKGSLLLDERGGGGAVRGTKVFNPPCFIRVYTWECDCG